MKFNLSLKDQQKEFMDQVVSDFSLGEIEISIQSLVKEILNQDDNENVLTKYIQDRYANWKGDLGNFIHAKKTTLEAIHQKVLDDKIEPTPKSGQQEYLENIINKYL